MSVGRHDGYHRFVRSELLGAGVDLRRVLGFFAHPDDEVFCGGGTFARLADAGAEVHVVSLTRGEKGQIRDAGVATRSTLGDVRVAELHAAAAALGLTGVHCHDYGDGTLATQPFDRLVDVAAEWLDRIRPDAVVAFGPDGGYGHPDHAIAGRAVGAALARHVPEVPLYHACFPRRSQLLLELIVSWLTGLDDRFRGSTEFGHALLLFADGSTALGYAADHMRIEWYPSGTLIIEQGEPASALYLVLSGIADVTRSEGGVGRHLAVCGPGSFVGEEGLAWGRPRNADVVARDPVTCLVLSPAARDLTQGRGEGVEAASRQDDAGEAAAEVVVDVRAQVERKMRAIAAYRSQYALSADMFPLSIVEPLLGVEYFNRAHVGIDGRPVASATR